MNSAQRRTDKLIVREVEGETVVYDTASEMVTVLDAQTAAVWQAADGAAPIEAIAEALEVPEETVEVALVRLGDAGLLKAAMSRRALLRGAGTAVAAGGLMTIMAPPAFAAASGVRKISGSGTCGVGQGVGANDVQVSVSGDGFSVGTVNFTITYNSGTAANPSIKTQTGSVTQSLTGTTTTTVVKLTNVRVGTTTASISATDSTGKTATGLVTLGSC